MFWHGTGEKSAMKVNKFKSERADLIEWVDTYGDIKRCAGGRIIHRTYCCLHCGSSDPNEDCGVPKPEYKKVKRGK